MNKNIKLKKQMGVTLVETIVSLGILTMGIISALALITSSIVYSQMAEQKIVVINLAREGIEMARAIRDFNITSEEGTIHGFGELTAGDQIIGSNTDGDLELATADSETIKSCQNCALSLYEGRYVHNASEFGSIATPFKRMLVITDISAGEKNIVSTVYWSERGRDHSFVLEESLTDW